MKFDVMMLTTLITVTYWLSYSVQCLATSTDGKIDGTLETFCESDPLRIRCLQNEAVLVTHARYGRMREGRCISNAYGVIGCSTDVIELLDAACSGRHVCDVNVATLVSERQQPCPKDFRSYLEVAYKCVAVAFAEKSVCRSSAAVEFRQPGSGYLSNLVAEETGCGTFDSPWWLTAPAGQRIRITLMDFTATARADDERSQGQGRGQGRDRGLTQGQGQGRQPICKVKAVIKEDSGSTGETICRDKAAGRRRVVYTSRGGHVEVRLTTANTRVSSATVTTSRIVTDERATAEYFLIHFEYVGCAELRAPVNGWIQRTGNDVTMGCNGTSVSWGLKCDGMDWKGVDYNCTPDVVAVNSGWLATFEQSKAQSLVLVIFIAGLVGVVILVCGLLYLRVSRQRHVANANRNTALMSGYGCQQTITSQSAQHRQQQQQQQQQQHLSEKSCRDSPVGLLLPRPPGHYCMTDNSMTSSGGPGTCVIVSASGNDYFHTLAEFGAQSRSTAAMCVREQLEFVGEGGGGGGMLEYFDPRNDFFPDGGRRPVPVVEHIYESPKLDAPSESLFRRHLSTDSRGCQVSAAASRCGADVIDDDDEYFVGQTPADSVTSVDDVKCCGHVTAEHEQR